MKNKLFLMVSPVLIITSLLFYNGSKEAHETNINKEVFIEILSEILDTSKTYLAFKGTDTKPGEIAKSYNLHHKKATHVGLLYFSGKWTVAHVTNVKKEGNNLYFNNIEDFFTDNSRYASVYEVKNVYKKDVLSNIDKIADKKIAFDLQFEKNNNKYYCAEFVMDMIDPQNVLGIHMVKKKIKNIQHRFFLKKDTLEYYPVDIFFENNNFKKIMEQ